MNDAKQRYLNRLRDRITAKLTELEDQLPPESYVFTFFARHKSDPQGSIYLSDDTPADAVRGIRELTEAPDAVWHLGRNARPESREARAVVVGGRGGGGFWGGEGRERL